MNRTIIGFDTSLATWGAAAVRYDDRGLVTSVVVAVNRTKPPEISKRLASHREFARAFVLRESPNVFASNLVGVEGVAFPFGKVRWSTISALARARQVVDDLFPDFDGWRPVEVSTQAVARAAVDRPGKASKAERVEALCRRYVLFQDAIDRAIAWEHLRESEVEHVADAFAVALCVAKSRPTWFNAKGSTTEEGATDECDDL
jgi:Holliday junction resolvasome RuvABC endonuclease subunit